jgi:hypothetical protein
MRFTFITEQEARKIIREELHSLLANYRDLNDSRVCITDRYNTVCYGTRPKYSQHEIIDRLIEGLENDKAVD